MLTVSQRGRPDSPVFVPPAMQAGRTSSTRPPLLQHREEIARMISCPPSPRSFGIANGVGQVQARTDRISRDDGKEEHGEGSLGGKGVLWCAHSISLVFTHPVLEDHSCAFTGRPSTFADCSACTRAFESAVSIHPIVDAGPWS